MKTILFICQANVGRSQMAVGFYNAFAKNSRAISAGIQDKRERYHNHPAPVVTDAMKAKGIDISKQEIKLVTKEMIAKSDAVVVLCCREEIDPYLIDERKFLFREIIDPAEQTNDIVIEARDKIEKVIKQLFELGYDQR